MYLFGKASTENKAEHRTNIFTKMIDACQNSDYNQICALIEAAKSSDKSTADINSCSTPLLNAAHHSLLARLVNQDEPILIASANKRFDIAMLLIKNGAHPNVKDETGQTMLHHLVRKACISQGDSYWPREVQDLFVEAAKQQRPLELDLTDESRVTPLMYAIMGRHDAMVQKLRELGAQLSDENKKVLEAMRKREASEIANPPQP